MARKNRVSVYDGIYHVTARIAHRAMLLAEGEVKDQIMEWISSVAAFSGVEVWAFCIMDNHLHLFLHVPPVPERYWLDPNDEPAAYAFGMRPPECREPLWGGDSPRPRTAAEADRPDGDSPSRPMGDSPSRPMGASFSRPGLGFMLDDEEMVARLAALYGPERVSAIGDAWAAQREHRRGDAVDEAKERYCRRMYNLSQYVKTLKERVSMWYNEAYRHSGGLWEGRFYSGVPSRRWSSYALAVSDEGPDGERCRRMYEKMLNRPWEEVRAKLEAMFADKLPESVTPENLREWLDDYDEDAEGSRENA